jgi:abortive infection bacteriophage resistance protein
MEKKFIDKFDKEIYNSNFKKNSVIKLHHKNNINDKYAPAWKTLEFFTFGTMVFLYKNLKNKQLQKEISCRYNIKNEKILENYFSRIVEIRNLCAHGNVLFDHSLSLRLINGPALKISNNSYQLYSVIQVIYFVLQSISKNRANDMYNELGQLFNKFKDNATIKSLLEKSIGIKNIQ